MTSIVTNATRRNHFCTFFIYLHKTIKFSKIMFFPYSSPWKGALTDAGYGDGGGATNHKQSQNKTVRTNIVHTSGHFSEI